MEEQEDGSGYYGGGASIRAHGGAGGGSSYISGHAGCIAINEDGTAKTSTYNNISDSYSYIGVYFTDTNMIDGAGCRWTTQKSEYVLMPTKDKKSTMIGNSGDGYCRISIIAY